VAAVRPSSTESITGVLLAVIALGLGIDWKRQKTAADRQKLTLGSTSNPDAYQLYLKGAYYTSKFTKDGFDKGVNYLNQAFALDPNYAQAYTALAWNYINQDDWFIAPREAAPKARNLAKKAIALDETNAEAHVVLAIENRWYEWDWAAAEREFKRAIELDPGRACSKREVRGTLDPPPNSLLC
jgi:Tfp pilus assembly protein PilF